MPKRPRSPLISPPTTPSKSCTSSAMDRTEAATRLADLAFEIMVAMLNEEGRGGWMCVRGVNEKKMVHPIVVEVPAYTQTGYYAVYQQPQFMMPSASSFMPHQALVHPSIPYYPSYHLPCYHYPSVPFNNNPSYYMIPTSITGHAPHPFPLVNNAPRLSQPHIPTTSIPQRTPQANAQQPPRPPPPPASTASSFCTPPASPNHPSLPSPTQTPPPPLQIHRRTTLPDHLFKCRCQSPTCAFTETLHILRLLRFFVSLSMVRDQSTTPSMPFTHPIFYALALFRKSLPSRSLSPSQFLLGCLIASEAHLCDVQTSTVLWRGVLEGCHDGVLGIGVADGKRRRMDGVKEVGCLWSRRDVVEIKRKTLEALQYNTFVGVEEYRGWVGEMAAKKAQMK